MLVDNGSTDHTLDLCWTLQSKVGDSVVVAQEPERGYAPARHRGNQVAARVAQACGFPRETLVVIQADADSLYSSNYVDRVRDTISAGAADSLVGQAITVRAPGLESRYPRVFAEIDAADQIVRRRFGPLRPDALVDDKACAYMLSDYERWGGHRREYLDDGFELLAETTRLTIAGLARGACRAEVAEAFVVHSQRRLLADAAQQLASAGFPYGDRRILPDRAAVTLNDLEWMVAHSDRELMDMILMTRAAHLAALTGMLPVHLARTFTGAVPEDLAARTVLQDVPHRTVHEAAATPGRFLADVLALASEPSALLARLNVS